MNTPPPIASQCTLALASGFNLHTPPTPLHHFTYTKHDVHFPSLLLPLIPSKSLPLGSLFASSDHLLVSIPRPSESPKHVFLKLHLIESKAELTYNLTVFS